MLKILILIIIYFSFHISIEHIYMNLSLKTNPIVEIIPKGLNFWTDVFFFLVYLGEFWITFEVLE